MHMKAGMAYSLLLQDIDAATAGLRMVDGLLGLLRDTIHATLAAAQQAQHTVRPSGFTPAYPLLPTQHLTMRPAGGELLVVQPAAAGLLAAPGGHVGMIGSSGLAGGLANSLGGPEFVVLDDGSDEAAAEWEEEGVDGGSDGPFHPFPWFGGSAWGEEEDEGEGEEEVEEYQMLLRMLRTLDADPAVEALSLGGLSAGAPSGPAAAEATGRRLQAAPVAPTAMVGGGRSAGHSAAASWVWPGRSSRCF